MDSPTLAELAAVRPGGSLVVAQLGQSLDGRIATSTGHSRYVNGPAALDLLHALRANVDAVVVGAGTAVHDDPQLTVRRVGGTNPARVLIDRTRRAGGRLRCLQPDGARRIVVGAPHPDDPEGVEYHPPPPDTGWLAPGALVALLASMGLRRILVEGGAATASDFLAAQAVDRLCLFVGPIILGCGPVGLNLVPIATVHEAIRPAVTVVPLAGGDVLFDCDLRSEPRQ